jgi:hypothetical protein
MKRLWRIAGILLIAHVVLLLAGYAQQRSPAFGAPPGSVARLLAGVPAGRAYPGFALVSLAWLILLAAITLIAGLVGGATETSSWFGRLIVAAGTAATVITLAGAYAPAFAAYYAATHGVPAEVVTAVETISKFSDLLAIAACGLTALAIGAAGLASGMLPRWLGWISIAVGIACMASGSGPKQLDMGTLAWFGWLVAMGVVAQRGPSRRGLARTSGAAGGTDAADRIRVELS